jgi:hypothetical protein
LGLPSGRRATLAAGASAAITEAVINVVDNAVSTLTMSMLVMGTRGNAIRIKSSP